MTILIKKYKSYTTVTLEGSGFYPVVRVSKNLAGQWLCEVESVKHQLAIDGATIYTLDIVDNYQTAMKEARDYIKRKCK